MSCLLQLKRVSCGDYGISEYLTCPMNPDDLKNNATNKMSQCQSPNVKVTIAGLQKHSYCNGTWFLVHLSGWLKCAIVFTLCLSSVPLSVRHPSLTCHIFDFSSETAEGNSTKLDWKQDLNVFYQVCVFRDDRKNKIAALASD